MNNHTPILEAAREYVSKVCCVIPIKKNTKEPLIEWKEYQGRIPNDNELRNWFEHTDNQLGIVTGSVSGNLFILDFDGENFEESFLEFLDKFPEFQHSFIVKTGSGKYHIYGRCDHFDDFFELFTKKIKQYPNGHVEFRVNGHQTLAPPSIHPSGNYYEVFEGTAWITVSLSKLYEILVWINPEGNGADTKKPEGWHEYILQGVSEGERNTSLVKETGRLLGKKLSRSEILPILLEANSSFNPPLDETEVESILDSMIKKDSRRAWRRELKSLKSTNDKPCVASDAPPEPKLTGEEEKSDLVFKDFSDTENARRFLKFNPDDFLWIEDLQRWWHFDSQRPGWGDGEMAVRSRIKETADLINKAVLQTPFADDRARLEKLRQCIAWKDANGIENSIKMLRDESFSQSTEFDTNPFLFLCKSGVINLKTEELEGLKPSDRLHKLSPVKFDPEAKCPQWEQFLKETFMDNQELIYFIQKFSGYTLTGDTREEKFLVLEGEGQNGKSTLLEVMAGILGDYGTSVPFATFKDAKWDQGGNAHQADMVQMIGARFIRSVEVKERARLNIERLKSLTGNDMMSARPPYARDAIRFYPVGKIWLAVNHLPRIYDTTISCWRRLLRVPFSYIVPPEKRILDLSKKLLKEESSGILNWMLDGCLLWQDEGLEPIPPSIIDATNEYQNDSTPVKQFISEECETGQFQVTCKDFYDSFVSWWKNEMGEIEPLSKKEIGKELKRMGFDKRVFKNTKYYIGLKSKRGID